MSESKWSKEINRFISIKPQFILWGNIYDVYPMEVQGNVVPLNLNNYMSNLLTTNEYDLILSYEPLFGFFIERGDEEKALKATGEKIKERDYFKASLQNAVNIIERIVHSKDISTALFLKFSSRLENIAKEDIEEFYYKMFRHLQNASPKMSANSIHPKFNSVFWFIDKENDMPTWYSLENPKLKSIPIPKPDSVVRTSIIENLSKKISGFSELDEKEQQAGISLFVDQTNNLHSVEILSIVTLAVRENIHFKKIYEAIKMYKLGIVENEWAKISTEKLTNSFEYLSKRVKGQNSAIEKTGDILKRAFFNLSGSQYSKHSSRPKGVMFLAGPTGVGKTEVAKSITELIFGSETSYIRFDMSEFAHEHSDQRLVGAPPGYVGYETGGELTNAVKENPFSVILFDEIEKSHPKILDIFLQILDDGRLTSGNGDTVYFSECLILFTSNLGVYEVTNSGERVQKVDLDMSYSEISKSIIQSINDFFKYKLQRPEILNRIGENLIVFDFIRPDIAKEIFEKMLNNILENVEENFDITIKITLETKEKLFQYSTDDLSMGGRGIGNKLENVFVNPLSRTIFDSNVQEANTLELVDIVEENNHWKLESRKS